MRPHGLLSSLSIVSAVSRRGQAICTKADVCSKDQLRAAGIISGARIGYNKVTPLAPLSSNRKRAAADDGYENANAKAQKASAHLQNLRTEVLELQIQADRATKIRLEKEKETERLARQTRHEWAELELAKANLEHQIAEEKRRAGDQEVHRLLLIYSFCILTESLCRWSRQSFV